MLSIIDKEMVYGYELSLKLQQFGLNDVSEGSIYPILLRFQKEELVTGDLWPSPSGGPKWKYYQLTEKGKMALSEFIEEWENIRGPVENIQKWMEKP